MPLNKEQLQAARKKIIDVGNKNSIPISEGRLKMLDNLLVVLGEGNKYKEGDPISKDDLDSISDIVNGVLDGTTESLIKQINNGKRDSVSPEYFMMAVTDHLYLRCIDRLGGPSIPAGFNDSVKETISNSAIKLHRAVTKYDMTKDVAFKEQRYKNADKLREEKLAPLMDSIQNGRAGAKQVGELIAEYQALGERQSRHGRIWRFFHKNENILRNELMDEMRRTIEGFLGENSGVDLDTVDPAKFAIEYAESQIRNNINEAITLRDTEIEKAYGVESNSALAADNGKLREHMPMNDVFSLFGDIDKSKQQVSQPIVPQKDHDPVIGDDAKTNEFTLLN